MAVGVSILKRYRRNWGGAFGIKDMLVEITGDNPYPAGGSTITAAQLNVNSILTVCPMGVYPLVNRKYFWNRSTGKLQAKVAAGTEVGAIDVSADKIVAVVYAR